MKTFLYGIFALVLSSSALAEVDKSNPYEMVKQVADTTFKRFANEQVEIRKNPNLLKSIVEEELMPYIDYRYAALKVIGKNMKKTSKADVGAFIPVFKDYLVTSYAQVFTLYNNQKVEFEPAKKLGKEKIVAVNTRVIQPGGDPIDISFKVRNDRRKKEWKAFDMIAEGVSLLDSKQAELNSIIRQKGLPYATEMLKEKAERDIVFKNEQS